MTLLGSQSSDLILAASGFSRPHEGRLREEKAESIVDVGLKGDHITALIGELNRRHQAVPVYLDDWVQIVVATGAGYQIMPIARA